MTYPKLEPALAKFVGEHWDDAFKVWNDAVINDDNYLDSTHICTTIHKVLEMFKSPYEDLNESYLCNTGKEDNVNSNHCSDCAWNLDGEDISDGIARDTKDNMYNQIKSYDVVGKLDELGL